jgi:CRISPR-associated protein Csx17
MSESEETIDWSKTTFEGSRREQLRRFRALSLREKMEAIEGMAALVQRFEQLRREGALRPQEDRTAGSGGGADSVVSESETPNVFTPKGKSRA